MKPTRYRDYCFREFRILLDGFSYRIEAKIWYSYENKPQGIMTEHLGETLTDSVRYNYEIEDVYIEGSNVLPSENSEEIYGRIEQELKKDYTQYFSLD